MSRSGHLTVNACVLAVSSCGSCLRARQLFKAGSASSHVVKLESLVRGVPRIGVPRHAARCWWKLWCVGALDA